MHFVSIVNDFSALGPVELKILLFQNVEVAVYPPDPVPIVAAAFGDYQQPLSLAGKIFHIVRSACDARNKISQIFAVGGQSSYGQIRFIHAEIVHIDISFVRGVVGMLILQVLAVRLFAGFAKFQKTHHYGSAGAFREEVPALLHRFVGPGLLRCVEGSLCAGFLQFVIDIICSVCNCHCTCGNHAGAG